jgi:hypothetical protein
VSARRGPLSGLLAPRQPEVSRETVPLDAAQLARENRDIKDKIARLCQKWRAEGSASHAAELERVMGWTPAGDPLTGCLPVTPEK